MNNIQEITSLQDIDKKILDKIITISQLPGVEKVFALPDIHIKGKGSKIGDLGFVPSSFGLLTKNIMYPQLVASNVNCGMSLLQTNIKYGDYSIKELEKVLLHFNKGFLKGLFLKIRRPFPNKYSLDKKEFKQVCLKGDKVLWDRFGVKDEDVLNRESQGASLEVENSFFSNLNKDWVKPHPYYKNNIGRFLKGNHFIEIQVVDEIFDKSKAQEWSIEKGKIFILYHMGQGGLTSFFNQKILGKIIDSKKIISLRKSDEFFTLIKKGIKWLISYGIACRFMTYVILRDLFQKKLSKNVNLKYFWDHTHDFIREYKIDNDSYFLHSNNANISKKNKPIILSGIKNMKTYVGYSDAHNLISSLYDHGYGYSVEKNLPNKIDDSTKKYNNGYVNLLRAKKEINSLFFVKKKNIRLEKNEVVDKILSDLEKNNNFNKVFSLAPIINYRFIK